MQVLATDAHDLPTLEEQIASNRNMLTKLPRPEAIFPLHKIAHHLPLKTKLPLP
jgi:hypothetical protein